MKKKVKEKIKDVNKNPTIEMQTNTPRPLQPNGLPYAELPRSSNTVTFTLASNNMEDVLTKEDAKELLRMRALYDLRDVYAKGGFWGCWFAERIALKAATMHDKLFRRIYKRNPDFIGKHIKLDIYEMKITATEIPDNEKHLGVM